MTEPEQRKIRLGHVQLTMFEYDLDTCKFIAKWLSRHIKLHEMDFTTLDASIADIGLSNRAYNVLQQNNITTLQQLLILASNPHHIRMLKGAGHVLTHEINEKVLKFQNTYIFKDKNVHTPSSL